MKRSVFAGAVLGVLVLTGAAAASEPITTPAPVSAEGCVSLPGDTCTYTSTRGGGYVARGGTWSLVVSVPAEPHGAARGNGESPKPTPRDPRDVNRDGKLTYTYWPTNEPEQGCALWPAGATVTIAAGSASGIAAGNPVPDALAGILNPGGDPEEGGRLSPCPGGQLPGTPR